MIIPILLNHDYSQIIGMIEDKKGSCNPVIKFHDKACITRDMLFQIFGGAGIQILEYQDNKDDQKNPFVLRAEIIEFSLCPKPYERKS